MIGINTFILTQSGGSEGLGFAIPSDVVRSVYNQIRKDGHVHRGQTGNRGAAHYPAMAKALKLPQDSGAITADVLPGGPADQAGMKIDDIIVDGKRQQIKDARDLQSFIYSQALDRPSTMTVRRDDKILSLSMKVIERRRRPAALRGHGGPGEKHHSASWAILVVRVDEKVQAMLPGLRHTYGLVIAAESPESTLFGRKPAGRRCHLRGESGARGHHSSGDGDARGAQIRRSRGDSVERDGSLMYITLELE